MAIWTTIVKRMEEERGPLMLFAVLLRADSPERWDVVVAAPWLDPSARESYEYLVNTVARFLTKREMLSISRIVPLHSDDPRLREIGLHAPGIGVGGWASGSPGGKFLGMDVTEVYLFADKRAA